MDDVAEAVPVWVKSYMLSGYSFAPLLIELGAVKADLQVLESA